MSLAATLVDLLNTTYNDALTKPTYQDALTFIKWHVDLVKRLGVLCADDWSQVQETYAVRSKRFNREWSKLESGLASK
jgi:hypothetical protein